MKVGFLGLGIMGQGMCATLLRAGFPVMVWNRTESKCRFAVESGATMAGTPQEVAAEADITIGMVSDPQAARDLFFGPQGVGAGIGENRGYIDMSTVDASTSQAIGQATRAVGGRFLEAPVSGTKKPAADGTLVILTAGDDSLNEQAAPLFEAMGKCTFYLGETGQAARMKLIVNMIMGGMMASFCEGLALAGQCGLSAEDLLAVLNEGALANPMFAGKGPLIASENFAPSFPLKHMQKDLRLAGLLGDELGQPLPSAAAADAAFIRARSMGLSEEDFCAVFKAITSQQ
jgi:3-hydroxyisobutyrate dehydrogenase-like beta-hydroxyacid dehydrogenase